MIACCLLGQISYAQPSKATGYIDIERVKRENPVPDVNIAKAQKEAQAIIAQTELAETPDLPEDISKRIKLGKVEAAPQKIPDYLNNDEVLKKAQKMDAMDLEKLAEKYNETLLQAELKKGPKADAQDFEAGRAYLFISSSIPKQTLQNLLNDAGRLNIAVFLKGNIGDDPLKFAGTQKFMNTMKIKTPPQLYIHPDAFQMFKITKVPALVVAASDVKDRLDEQGCAAPEDYDIISGDLQLSANIEEIYQKASSPDIKDIARYYMKYVRATDKYKN